MLAEKKNKKIKSEKIRIDCVFKINLNDIKTGK
jgi:competence transcription factor ComK